MKSQEELGFPNFSEFAWKIFPGQAETLSDARSWCFAAVPIGSTPAGTRGLGMLGPAASKLKMLLIAMMGIRL